MKEKIKNILSIALAVLCITSITVNAATLMKSKDVIYDNKNTGMSATDVQSAVDELYSAATDYSTLSAEIQSLKTTVNTLTTNSFLNAHPVGSIYITISSNENTVTKMHNLYGGTWEKYGEGKTIISSGTNTDSNGNVTTYSVGDTGGNTGVTLTTANLPSHNHSFTPSGTNSYTTSAVTTGNNSVGHTHSIPALSGTTSSTSKTLTGTVNMHGASTGAAVHGVSGIVSSQITNTSYAAPNVVSGAESIGSFIIDATHTHNITTTASTTGGQSANHTHSITAANLKTAIGTITFTGTAGTTGNTGSGAQVNIQNPYIVVYMYKRVS